MLKTSDPLDEESCLHVHRIYIISNASDDDMPSRIHLRLLPLGAVSEFDDTMEEVLELGKDWPEDQLCWS